MTYSLMACLHRGVLLAAASLLLLSAGCRKGDPVGNMKATPLTAPASVNEPSSHDMPRLAGRSVEEQMRQIVALGTGVYKILKDANGRIKQCIVVGEALIIPHTPGSRDIAVSASKQAAIWRAYAEFDNWLKKDVHLEESKPPISQLTMTSQSKAVISGIQLLHISVSDGESTVKVALGWNATPGNEVMLPKAVRSESLDITNSVIALETTENRIWIDDILVIEEVAIFSDAFWDIHYRQWDAIGQPLVDVVMKVDRGANREVTIGTFWEVGGLRIPVNITDQSGKGEATLQPPVLEQNAK